MRIIVGIKTLCISEPFLNPLSLNFASSLEDTEDSCYLSFIDEKIFTQNPDNLRQNSQLKM